MPPKRRGRAAKKTEEPAKPVEEVKQEMETEETPTNTTEATTTEAAETSEPAEATAESTTAEAEAEDEPAASQPKAENKVVDFNKFPEKTETKWCRNISEMFMAANNNYLMKDLKFEQKENGPTIFGAFNIETSKKNVRRGDWPVFL